MANYFFVKPDRVKGQEITVEDHEFVHRVRNVLRMRKGAQAVIMDNTGKRYRCELVEPSRERIVFEIEEVEHPRIESKLKVQLCPALIDKNRFETVLEKGTEMGVESFQPLITERTELRINSVPDRWKRIVREASEQSRRLTLPDLNSADSFERIIGKSTVEGRALLLDPGGKEFDFRKTDQPTSLLVGPEGGFTRDELKTAENEGAEILSLGERPLRAETACIVGAGLLLF